jgi:hypothetical protein
MSELNEPTAGQLAEIAACADQGGCLSATSDR